MRGHDAALARDVALANRILERLGLAGAFGHASARLADPERFLIPTRRSPGLADEHALLSLDTEGKVRAGDGQPNSESWIHARLYAARPDVRAVVHAHPPACVALTQIGEPLRVVHNHGGPFAAGVPEYGEIGLIRTRELGDRLAATLGGGIAVTMRGHGITTVAADVRTATIAAIFLEEGAALQLSMLAAAGGDARRVRAFTRDEAARVADHLGVSIVERAWEYYAAVAEALPLGAAGLARRG